MTVLLLGSCAGAGARAAVLSASACRAHDSGSAREAPSGGVGGRGMGYSRTRVARGPTLARRARQPILVATDPTGMERSVITTLDDYPIHQTSLPVAFPATSDRNFYDRFWFCGFVGDGSL